MNPYFGGACPYRPGLFCQEADGCGNCLVAEEEVERSAEIIPWDGLVGSQHCPRCGRFMRCTRQFVKPDGYVSSIPHLAWSCRCGVKATPRPAPQTLDITAQMLKRKGENVLPVVCDDFDCIYWRKQNQSLIGVCKAEQVSIEVRQEANDFPVCQTFVSLLDGMKAKKRGKATASSS